MTSPIVMYIILRRDLLTTLKWPIGAAVAQTCHASTAILWKCKDDECVTEYMKHMDSMRKVVLEVDNEDDLKNLSASLTNANVTHKLWIEQPENIATCIAVKPYPKQSVHKLVKHLPLFS